MTTTIRVEAERPYDVLIGRGCAFDLAGTVPDADRVALIHPRDLRHQAEALAASLEAETVLVEVPTGEKAKRTAVLDGCWRVLAESGFTRSDAVVGVGGGATTDLAGFVAATWLRGVRYVSVPTSLLAMVDAAVGGKTGINLAEGKNLVGAFWEPAAVLIDLEFLDTLPADDLRGGLAEMAKHGFIGDARTLELFEGDPAALLDPRGAALAEAVERSIALKAGVVSADLREATSVGAAIGREALNYGHTLGHAVERREQFRWRHGYAVSVGMVYAASLARRLGMLTDADVARHVSVLASVGLPTTYDAGAWDDLRATMNLDKKARGGDLRFVLLDGVGSPTVVRAPDEDVLAAAYADIAG